MHRFSLKSHLVGPMILACFLVFACFCQANVARAQQPEPYARYINAETQAVMMMRPAAIAQNPTLKSLSESAPALLEDMSSSFEDRFGVPVTSCQIFMSGQLADATLKELQVDINQSFMIAVFDRAIDQDAVLAGDELTPEWEKVDFEGGTYFRPKQTPPAANDPPDFEDDPALRQCVAFPAENIYVETTEAKIRSVLSGKSSDEWNNRLAAIPNDQIVTAIVGPQMLPELFEELPAEDLPPGITKHLPTMQKVQRAEIGVSLTGDNLLRVSLEAANGEDAAEVQAAAAQLLEMGKNMAPLVFMNAGPGIGKPEQDAAMAMIESITASADGATAQVTLPMPAEETRQLLFNSLAQSLTVAQAAASQAEQMNKMRMVGIAMHNFVLVEEALPPGDDEAARDADGRPLLSWRVHILRYLDAGDLYEKFHLDEAWDSPHNKKLLAEMPDMYALSNDLPEGMTDMLAPFGKNTSLGGVRSVHFRDVMDGTSNTALCFQVAPEHAVPWTKPDDFQFDPEAEDATALFKIPGVEEFIVLWMDASVDALPNTISADAVKQIIEINDRLPTSRDAIR